MAPARTLPHPLTTLLLVRHGKTPTTGKLLPGRAAGPAPRRDGRAAGRAAPPSGSPSWSGSTRSTRSPLERARETAAPIAKATGLKPQIERGLLECDFGDWTGAELRS